MGYWGFGVLDGDTPLDIIDTVTRLLGLSTVTPVRDIAQWDKLDRDAVSRAINTYELKRLHNRVCDELPGDAHTVYLVLGLIAVASGAELPDDYYAKVLSACDHDNVQRFEEPDARRFSLASLKTLVQWQGEVEPEYIDRDGDKWMEALCQAVDGSTWESSEDPDVWYVEDDEMKMHGPYSERDDAVHDADRIDGRIVKRTW